MRTKASLQTQFVVNLEWNSSQEKHSAGSDQFFLICTAQTQSGWIKWHACACWRLTTCLISGPPHRWPCTAGRAPRRTRRLPLAPRISPSHSCFTSCCCGNAYVCTCRVRSDHSVRVSYRLPDGRKSGFHKHWSELLERAQRWKHLHGHNSMKIILNPKWHMQRFLVWQKSQFSSNHLVPSVFTLWIFKLNGF